MSVIRKFCAGIIMLTVIGGGVSARADDGELFGTGIGAALGGLFGSQFGHGGGQLAATGAGIVAGGLIGDAIGRDIDHQSSAAGPAGTLIYSEPAPVYATYAPNYVAPPAPPPIYINTQMETYCREYSQPIVINGRAQESYGTVCLQPDGTWRPVQ